MSAERALFAPERINVVFSKMMAGILFSSVLLVVSAVSMAGTKVVPVEEINYSYTINTSMMDNLNALTGKKVSLTLDGGKVLTGIVKSVGARLVHLQEIERKEVFDLLIRIDRIQAIETQLKEY